MGLDAGVNVFVVRDGGDGDAVRSDGMAVVVSPYPFANGACGDVREVERDSKDEARGTEYQGSRRAWRSQQVQYRTAALKASEQLKMMFVQGILGPRAAGIWLATSVALIAPGPWLRSWKSDVRITAASGPDTGYPGRTGVGSNSLQYSSLDIL
ncbi:hypothetical protein B0H10DRAFT_1945304 [Mycena sp. CBHHK59/15]|nr:hypothetical protein B0H10DRAFT_1945304 [Mycena sp. CBHHK59/15]